MKLPACGLRAVVAVLSLAACAQTQDAAPTDDADTDVAADEGADVPAVDVPPIDIAPIDVQPDLVPMDVRPDLAPMDVQPDLAPIDATRDAAMDAPADAAMDAPMDAPMDAALDVALDVASDVASDARADGPFRCATSADCAGNPLGPTCCAGACVDAQRDMANCGVCGVRCDAPSGTAACVAGRCTLPTCPAGLADCDGLFANGCETELATSPTACGACGHACASGVCRAGACVVFGGIFETSDPTCDPCHDGNPAAAGCGCPAGTAPAAGLRILNDCVGSGSRHGGAITVCQASAPGDWAGAFQVDDPVPGGSGCRTPNAYTADCSCPKGTVAITFRTLVDGSGGVIGSRIVFCAAPGGPSPSFGGAFQRDDSVPGGIACRAPNPYTGGCSCAPGTTESSLRVEVDGSAGFIGSAIVYCLR